MMYLQGFDDFFCSHKMVDHVFGPMVDYLGGKPVDNPASSRKPKVQPTTNTSGDLYSAPWDSTTSVSCVY
jgi:hypothetical protein